MVIIVEINHSKMLQKVSIQNFKSLKDVTLELQKVNLLIGPNNSGKSNFLKALEFVASIDNLNKNDKSLKFFLKLSDVFQKSTDKIISIKMTLDKVAPGTKQNEALLEMKYREFDEKHVLDN